MGDGSLDSALWSEPSGVWIRQVCLDLRAATVEEHKAWYEAKNSQQEQSAQAAQEEAQGYVIGLFTELGRKVSSNAEATLRAWSELVLRNFEVKPCGVCLALIVVQAEIENVRIVFRSHDCLRDSRVVETVCVEMCFRR